MAATPVMLSVENYVSESVVMYIGRCTLVDCLGES